MACCLTAPSHYLNNVDWSSVKSSDIHIRAISQEMPQPSIININLKITCLKFHKNLPGGNELIYFCSQMLWGLGCQLRNRHNINIVTGTWLKFLHDDVIKWEHFPCHWPFLREIHRSPVKMWTISFMTRYVEIFPIVKWLQIRYTWQEANYLCHYGWNSFHFMSNRRCSSTRVWCMMNGKPHLYDVWHCAKGVCFMHVTAMHL